MPELLKPAADNINTPSTFTVRGTHIQSSCPMHLTPAETRLVFSLEKHFPSNQIFADYYLPRASSHPSSPYQETEASFLDSTKLIQIDCIAVNEWGIFVFESKDFVGWIYGHGNRQYWTQVSAYGRNKQPFYNPIRQNSTHIDALKSTLSQYNVPYYSVIVFGRDATLKVIDDIPEQCYVCTQNQIHHFIKDITEKQKNQISKTIITELVNTLKLSRIMPNLHIRENHIEEIREHINSNPHQQISTN